MFFFVSLFVDNFTKIMYNSMEFVIQFDSPQSSNFEPVHVIPKRRFMKMLDALDTNLEIQEKNLNTSL